MSTSRSRGLRLNTEPRWPRRLELGGRSNGCRADGPIATRAVTRFLMSPSCTEVACFRTAVRNRADSATRWRFVAEGRRDAASADRQRTGAFGLFVSRGGPRTLSGGATRWVRYNGRRAGVTALGSQDCGEVQALHRACAARTWPRASEPMTSTAGLVMSPQRGALCRVRPTSHAGLSGARLSGRS